MKNSLLKAQKANMFVWGMTTGIWLKILIDLFVLHK